MTDKEILEKAIKNAHSNGWNYPFNSNVFEIAKYVTARPYAIAFGKREPWQEDGQHLEGHWSIEELIFNHDFAKALWGEEPYEKKSDNYLVRDGRRAWMVHLQGMVIAPNRLKYLGEHLDD